MQWVMSSEDGRVGRHRSWTNFVFAALMLTVSSLTMACTDPEKPQTTSSTSGSSSSSSSGSGGSGGGDTGGGGMGGMPVDKPGPVEEVMKFDPAMGELPEGIAIDGTTAYVTFGSTKVIKIDLMTNMRSDFGDVAAPLGIGSPQGIALDGVKTIFMAVSSSDPVQFKPGIYKFPPGGGTATLWAEHINMSYPRHIGFHSSGSMVVAGPTGARLFTITSGAVVTAAGPTQLLSGDQGSACAYGGGMAYGISSVVFDGDTMLAANADRAQILEGGMGMMGANLSMNPELTPGDCTTLGGAESIIIDPYDKGGAAFDVAMLVASRAVNKITKIRYTGGIEVIADKTNLYEPSAIALAVIGSDRYLYIVNSARTTYASGGIPGLVRMRLGVAK